MQAGTSPNRLQHELCKYTIGHSCEAEDAIQLGLVIRLYNVSKWDACVDNPMKIKKSTPALPKKQATRLHTPKKDL